MSSASRHLINEQNTNNVEYWQDYALDLYRIGKLTDSIKALRNAEKLEPNNIVINHQIGFLHYKNNDHKTALNYADRAIEISSLLSGKPDKELLSFKALVYEDLNPEKALDCYLDIIDEFENDPDAYDRTANLVIDKFKFSDKLLDLNSVNSEYHQATQLLRTGEIAGSIELYKKAIKINKYCYPAYIGAAQALYELNFGSVKLNSYPETSGLDELFVNYKSLNPVEKNIVNASVGLFERYIKDIKKNNSDFIIAPIDVKLTDYPHNHYLKGKEYYLDVPFCHLRGIGGNHAFVGIERLRDFTWDVSPDMPLVPGCIAHEFAHQVWCVLGKKVQAEVKKLYQDSVENNRFVSNYSRYNPEEYFAEYCVSFSRNILLYNHINNEDPMVDLLKSIIRA